MASTPRIGIPWYRRRDYPEVLKIMADRDQFPATYHGWKQLAKDAETRARAKGFLAVRAVIDPASFPAWCAERGVAVGPAGRAAWANEAAYPDGMPPGETADGAPLGPGGIALVERDDPASEK